MFSPVPPRDEAPVQEEAHAPADTGLADLPMIARPAPSVRWRVVGFALVGGGITAIIGGIVVGTLSWILWSPGEYNQLSSQLFPVRTFLAPTIFSTMVSLAPWLFLVFALAGAAQAIAESMSRAAGRAARLMGEVVSDSAGDRRGRRTAERGGPPVQVRNLEIDAGTSSPD
jgi:hypothetical protein